MSMQHQKDVGQDTTLKVAVWFLVLFLICIFVLGVVLVAKGAIDAVFAIILSVSIAIGFFGEIRRITGI